MIDVNVGFRPNNQKRNLGCIQVLTGTILIHSDINAWKLMLNLTYKAGTGKKRLRWDHNCHDALQTLFIPLTSNYPPVLHPLQCIISLNIN